MRKAILIVILGGLIGCGGNTPTPPSPSPSVAAQATTAPTPTSTIMPTATNEPTLAPTPTIPVREAASGRAALVRGQLTQRPLIVMIDNHPNAYPQTGLDEAVVVFEALAEFGITRYMAVYAPEIAVVFGEIGPVRSARLYFVQWAMGMQGVYVHAGGSPTGLERLAADNNTTVINFDALEAEQEAIFFRRDTARIAPHNLYINQANIEAFLAQDDHQTPTDAGKIGFLFAPETPMAPTTTFINYYFLYSDDPVRWEYDQLSNRYYRFRRGVPHIDAVSGEQLWFKSVAVMEVQEAPIPGDEKSRIDQQVIGEGSAMVFANGTQIEATWRKETETAQLRFFDSNGVEIAFPVGPVWITALPSLENLTIQ